MEGPGAAARGNVSLHNFSARLWEQLVHFHVMRLTDSLFLWVGATPHLRNLSVAMCTRYDPIPVSTALLGDMSDTTSTGLAQRLGGVQPFWYVHSFPEAGGAQGTTAVASCRQERKDRPGPGAGLCWEQAPPGVPSVRRPHGSHTETSGPGLLGHRGTPSGAQAAPRRHHPVAQGLVLPRRLSRPRVAPGSGIAGSTSSGPFLSPAVLWPDRLARPRAPSRKWYCSLSDNT
ncbi:proteasome assembly chaperone 4 isoform X1 [Lagenorhynchus albirostris]|uniref:proteasome assembly chaperone 4 isoform X1 n=1 Tax=Lagenorhynchus albirostris TaxID=27610 RepID=UPI0028E5B021|nr:proteasome assembly chaperone 4 isoform X1 [Lagenorhynchus albirostris]